MKIEEIERSLSMTESIVLTSLDANWINYKLKDNEKWLYLLFTDEEKLKKAVDIISNKLKDHEFKFELLKYIVKDKIAFYLLLWWEQIFFEVEQLPVFLDKIKQILFKLLKK